MRGGNAASARGAASFVAVLKGRLLVEIAIPCEGRRHRESDGIAPTAA
jgi:hypothetical protein